MDGSSCRAAEFENALHEDQHTLFFGGIYLTTLSKPYQAHKRMLLEAWKVLGGVFILSFPLLTHLLGCCFLEIHPSEGTLPLDPAPHTWKKLICSSGRPEGYDEVRRPLGKAGSL